MVIIQSIDVSDVNKAEKIAEGKSRKGKIERKQNGTKRSPSIVKNKVNKNNTKYTKTFLRAATVTSGLLRLVISCDANGADTGLVSPFTAAKKLNHTPIS